MSFVPDENFDPLEAALDAKAQRIDVIMYKITGHACRRPDPAVKRGIPCA